MGTWGTNIYQDDFTLDIKEGYKDKLYKGKTNQEALQEIINENQEEIKDIEDAPLFWFALADAQWDLGRLDEYVKQEALKHIDLDLLKWKGDTKLYQKRIKVLKKLREKLNSPQPKEKKITKYRLYKCEWKIGDVFAYKLETEVAIKNKLKNKYLILQKVDEGEWYPGHIVPIVRAKITETTNLPVNEEEINKLEYIQISFTKYENRFLPLSGDTPIKDQIEEKSKTEYQTDEYGYLPQYLLTLISTSKKIIPKKLVYIGNFKNIDKPEIEFIPHSKINITSFMWKELEEEIIERYIGHNKRKFQIYK